MTDKDITADGDKGFLFWRQEGEQKGAASSIFGINVFICNDEGRISEVLGFRQFLASERSTFLRCSGHLHDLQ